jgi:hypothetical protein
MTAPTTTKSLTVADATITAEVLDFSERAAWKTHQEWTVTGDPERFEIARESLQRLIEKHRRHVRWFAACKAAQDGDFTAWNKLRVPGKAYKHQMYGHAEHVCRVLGIEGRAQDMFELELVIRVAADALQLNTRERKGY